MESGMEERREGEGEGGDAEKGERERETYPFLSSLFMSSLRFSFSISFHFFFCCWRSRCCCCFLLHRGCFFGGDILLFFVFFSIFSFSLVLSLFSICAGGIFLL